jgi:predicted  nucleic acid-binding Zn-ribbon protein
MSFALELRVEELSKKVKKYEKALEEITRQYDYTTVNRAKEIASEALGELTGERRRKIQSS